MEHGILDAILQRRSIRKYKDLPVPDALRTQLLRAAMSAPSACNQQSWRFVVIEEREILKEISQIHGGFTALKTAQLAILVCGEPKATQLECYWEYDCSAATQNMLIAARALGLGSVWMGINQKTPDDAAPFRRILNIPEDLQPFSLVAVGYADETPKAVDRFDEGKIHFGKFEL